jgi:hypothetical protein
MKYGGGAEDVRRLLATASEAVAEIERDEYEILVFEQIGQPWLDQGELTRMKETVVSRRENLGHLLTTAISALKGPGEQRS